jgi:cupin fold WbuC family metalloprotein
MLRTITQNQIDELIQQAHHAPRKRVIYRLHEHDEPVQRMVNALVPGTYIAPHKHESPDKVELFNILKGHVAVLEFDAYGSIANIVHLQAQGIYRIVDIVPRTYHTIFVLEPSALLEIIQGPYDATTHKQFASWCPSEDSPKARDYMIYLESIIENWRG